MKKLRSGANLVTTVVGRSLNVDSILYPSQLSYMVTKMCNARCRMCNIWKTKKTDDLQLKEIEKLAKSRYLRKVMFLGISGGEPFLRKDLVEAILTLSSNMKLLKEIRLSTNGTLTGKMEKDLKELLRRTKCRIDVTISLDGLGNTHDMIRGQKGFFERVQKTLIMLKKLKGSDSRLDIGIRQTIIPENINETMKLYDFSKIMGINFTFKPATGGGLYDNLDGYSFWYSRFTEKQKQEMIETIQKITDLEAMNLNKRPENTADRTESRMSLSNASGFQKIKRTASLLFLRYMIDYIKNPKKNVFPCYACFSSAFLENNGDLYTCPVLYRKIGSIRESGFDELWQSREIRDARKFIKQGKCACYTNCNQIPSLVFSEMPRILLMLLKNKTKG